MGKDISQKEQEKLRKEMKAIYTTLSKAKEELEKRLKRSIPKNFQNFDSLKK